MEGMDASTGSRLPALFDQPGKRLFLFSLLISVIALSIGSAHAAVQGTKGPTSGGSVDVVYVSELQVRINGFADMAFGTWPGTGSFTADDNLCIGRTGVGFFGTGIYRILASGDGEPGNPAAFTLSNGIDRLYYRAFFNDETGTAGRQELTPGVMMLNQSGSGFSFVLNMLANCLVENANVSVEVPESELTNSAGSYVGTLALVLIPE